MAQFNIYRDYFDDHAVYSFDPYDPIFHDLDRQYSGDERKAAGPWAIVTAPDGAEVAEDATGMLRLYLSDGTAVTARWIVAFGSADSGLGIRIDKVGD